MPPITRSNVTWIEARARERLGNRYVYGGVWSKENIHAGCDCSALAAHLLNGVLYGPHMRWQRIDPASGAWITTESWRPIEVGQRGPFGTITVARPQDIPRDAIVKLALHHGPGGGANSHMWCELNGTRYESAGSKGFVSGNSARPINDSYGNDWAYLPGTIAEPSPVPPPPKGFLMALNDRQQQEIYDKIMGYPGVPRIAGRWPSRSMWALDESGIDDTVGTLLNLNGRVWDDQVILGALLGVDEDADRINRAAAGDLAPQIAANPAIAARAVKFARKVQPLIGALANLRDISAVADVPRNPSDVPRNPSDAPRNPSDVPPAIEAPTPVSPPPVAAPGTQPGEKPVLFTVNGFMGDMWQQVPADTARQLGDRIVWQPVGYDSGAFPLGIGADSGRRELRRLLTEEYPGRRFLLAGYSLGAIVATEVLDDVLTGDLSSRRADFLGGVAWGNPRQQGTGIAGPGNMANTPATWRNYANAGDIYPLRPERGGDNYTLVYNLVMTDWDGSLQSLVQTVARITDEPLQTVVGIVAAVVGGITFFADQTPHTSYTPAAAVEFLRTLV